MLYDTVGPAVLATVGPDEFQSTVQFAVNFLRPVRPGRLVGRGRVVGRDGNMAHVEASLFDTHEELLATATAVAKVIPLSEARNSV
jgi:acyl-coenzyme A thioesterase PaaI-like protein